MTVPTFSAGSVCLIDSMGSDLSVINAARVSFDRWEDTVTDRGEGLIRYLARNRHWTPFGHVQVSLLVHMPVFVARQLMRTQVGLVANEVSRRYVDDEPEFYVMPPWRGRPDASIKQGSGGEIGQQAAVQELYEASCRQALAAYNDMLELGVAPEQARVVLPLSHMTKVAWTGSLVAWSRMCGLRLDPHAQAESAWFAARIGELCRGVAPLCWAALEDGR